MSLEVWLAFVATATLLVLIPGPTVLLVVSYALGQGWRAAFPAAVGVALGDFTAMALSLLGIGTLLMASATVFTVVKWAGAAYLVYLGIKLFRAGGTPNADPRSTAVPRRRMLGHAWLVTSLNPKGIIFFVALFPQFINPDLAFLPQVAVFAGTFLVITSVNAMAYAVLVSRARGLVKNGQVLKTVNRVGGAMLVSAGIGTVALRSGA